MKYLNALNTIHGLGTKRMKILMNFFGSSENIWQASFEKLCQSGIPEQLAEKIVNLKEKTNPDVEWEKLERENIRIFCMNDKEYPELLKQIPDHPYLIYMRGDLACLDFPLVAIVGSRKLTNYGQQAALSFARDLTKNGICVVSGLAFGIDACAHNGALESKGRTIAVLGNSLNNKNIQPRSNYDLAQEILNNGGLLISEYPVPTEATQFTFPARNRIMAGMCLGTLVVEAAEKSGSLITANLALDYNREVFAVPGPIFSPQSAGTNLLIKKGAKPCSCIQDIMEELKLDFRKNNIENNAKGNNKTPKIELNEQEEKIYAVLSHESSHIDIITKLTKLDTATVSSTLAVLEIKGAIKNVGGQNYIKL